MKSKLSYELLEEEIKKLRQELVKSHNSEFLIEKQKLLQQNKEYESLNEALKITIEELRAANEELEISKAQIRENEKKYRTVVEDQTDFIDRFLPDGTITFATPLMCKIMGVNYEDLIGKNVLSFTPKTDKPKFGLKKWIAIAKPNDIFELEQKTVLPDGKIVWIHWTNKAIFDKNNKIAEIQAVGRDITERKKSELALKESEIRFRTLFDSAGDAIFLIKDGNFIDCNNKALEMFGCKYEEIIGETPGVFSPEFQPNGEKSIVSAKEQLTKALEGESQFFEWQHKKLDGTIFDTEIILTSIELSSGKTIQAIVRDVTKRKKTERILKESEEKFRNIIENLTDIYYRTDIDGKITFASPSILDAFMFSDMKQVIGTSIKSLYKNPNKRDEFIKLVKEKQKVKNFQAKLLKKNGEYIYTETTAKIILDSNKNYAGVEGITRDVTDRKQSEILLHKRLKFIEFTNDISTRFINIKSDDLEHEIMKLLKATAIFTDVQRAYVALLSEDENKLELVYEWCEKKASQQNKTEKKAFSNSKDYQDFISLLKKDENIKLHSTDLRDIYEHKSKCISGNSLIIKSFIALPMFANKKLIGYIGFDTTKKQKKWTNEILDSFNLCNHIITNTILRHRIEKALSDSEKTYKNLFENNPLALWEEDWSGAKNHIEILKKQGIIINAKYLNNNPNFIDKILSCVEIVNVNKTAFKLLKFKNIDELKKYTYDRTSKSVATMKQGIISLFNNKRLFSSETEFVDADGKKIDVVLFIQATENYKRVIFTLTDISEQKEAEMQLKKYAKTQQVLVREVNHRVKNNLSAIISMMNKEIDNAEAKGLPYSSIHELTERVRGLATVHGLLSQNNWQPLLLNELCQEIIIGRSHNLPLTKKIKHEIISHSEVYLNGNLAHHLTLVINELVTNTIKYALKNKDLTKILIVITKKNNSIYLEYSDDGAGYPEEIISGDFSNAGIGFDIIKGIVNHSLAGKLILKNEQGAKSIIIFEKE